jgi:non-specific serine/threonine protein kinase
LTRALSGRELLLLLDNCEQVVTACATLVARVLADCPSVTVLATSREVINAVGEAVVRVPPLNEEEATQLFTERAEQLGCTTQLVGKDESIIRLCQRLDGLPLAIELAAASLTYLSVEEIGERLDQRLSVLASGNRSVPARHQTLRALVDWSHDLLTSSEQLLFRRMSVFAGGCSLEEAEGVCGSEVGEIDSCLRGLVEKSLLVAVEEGGRTRYRLLETLRQYATEQLRFAGEERRFRTAHLDWFAGLAQRGEIGLRNAEQGHWLTLLRRELENLRFALTWSSIDRDRKEAGLRLISSLANFWWWIGYPGEALSWLETLSEDVPAGSVLAKARAESAGLRLRQGFPKEAEGLASEAVQLSRKLGLAEELAISLLHLGQAILQQGRADEAIPLLRESLRLARDLRGWPRVYRVLFVLGRGYEVQGAIDLALGCQQEALSLAQRQQDGYTASVIHRHLGSLMIDRGDLSAAKGYLRQSVHAGRSIASSHIAPALAQFAGLAAADGDMSRALRLGGAAVGLRDAVSARLQPADVRQLERRLAGARESLGQDLRDRLWAQGLAMTAEEALSYALEQQAASPTPLTERESQVVRLLSEGLSNREIAHRLVISEGTAKRHVENILAKLGLRSRAQVGDWYASHELDSH